MRKRKLGLFFDTEPSDGGKFQYCLSILNAFRALPRDQFGKVVACGSNGWRYHLSEAGIDSIFVNLRRWQWFYNRIWKNALLPEQTWRVIVSRLSGDARNMIRQQCDLWLFPSETNLSYQLPVPALVTIFDLMHRYEPRFPEVMAYGRGRRRDRHYRNACRWSEAVLVDSEVGKNQVIESYSLDPAKIHVLPYIPPNYLFNQSSNKNDAAKKYKLPTKFIFYPAQFWQHKNHKNLLKAVGQLKNEIVDIKLVLVGSKKGEYQSILRLVESLGLKEHVVFLGYVPNDNMSVIYRCARALVMPTFFGATNIPPLEAFATGCPVAVSNIYAMPEQVGDAAILFNPHSVNDIANAIRRLWIDDELCANLFRKGFERSKAWGQRQFDQRVLEIVSAVLSNKDRP